MLEMPPAELPLGKDLENNIIYVWPYLAEAKLDKLTPAEEVDLLRLVSPGEGQGDAERQEVDLVAAHDRRRRHLAFLQEAGVRRRSPRLHGAAIDQ